MIEFAWPLIFLLLPLPLLINRWLTVQKLQAEAALIVPDLDDFTGFKKDHSSSFPKFKTVLAALMWSALIAAAARPQWAGELVELPKTGRDLMLAVDLSGSMQMKDFEVNRQMVDRLTALKIVAGEFIERRKGDRIGLILFGSNAYLQAPLTFDTETVKQLLMESAVGLAGNETAIGDAIGLAIKQMRNPNNTSSDHDGSDHQVLILLTDGINNAGELTPERAAEIASHVKLKIYTIAIGSKDMMIQTVFGPRKIDPSANLDENTLQLIAQKTGGKYFRAYDTKELAQIYHEIDQLEAIEKTKEYYRPIEEVYYWPLLFSLICSILLLFTKSLLR
ncbi:MAG: VWA domain-containing protein [Parachlamydiaceae bacterium]